jgi:hypothetical protein
MGIYYFVEMCNYSAKNKESGRKSQTPNVFSLYCPKRYLMLTIQATGERDLPVAASPERGSLRNPGRRSCGDRTTAPRT